MPYHQPHLSPVALITGAAKRLGQTIALELAQAGFAIGVHYKTSLAEAEETVAAIRAMGVRAEALQADLADEQQTLALMAQCTKRLGTVGVLVNNASLFEYDALHDFAYARLTEHMLPNLAAPLLLARQLHAQLPATDQGVVINLLDQKLYNLNPDFLSYTLSKAGLEAATTLLAQTLAPQVRVVGIAPGITLASGNQTEAQFAQAHTQTPLGYASDPHDIAQAVRYAVMAKAMTGTTLLVDGGQHLQASARDVMFLTPPVTSKKDL